MLVPTTNSDLWRETNAAFQMSTILKSEKHFLTDRRIPLESPLALLNSRPALHQTLFCWLTAQSGPCRSGEEWRREKQPLFQRTIPLFQLHWTGMCDFTAHCPSLPSPKTLPEIHCSKSPPISTQSQHLQLGFNVCAWGATRMYAYIYGENIQIRTNSQAQE